VAILLAGAPDPGFAAHALLAVLAAEHVAGVLPELGEQRLRAGLMALVAALAASRGESC
jgi:preprotein translocase subunit SecD